MRRYRAGIFEVLGVRAIVRRTFLPADDSPAISTDILEFRARVLVSQASRDGYGRAALISDTVRSCSPTRCVRPPGGSGARHESFRSSRVVRCSTRWLTIDWRRYIFNLMADDSVMNDVFHALAHDARRAMLARLASGDLTVGELAEPFPMSLEAASKHIQVLERAGLVRRTVEGRRHICTLSPAPLASAYSWLGLLQALLERAARCTGRAFRSRFKDEGKEAMEGTETMTRKKPQPTAVRLERVMSRTSARGVPCVARSRSPAAMDGSRWDHGETRRG